MIVPVSCLSVCLSVIEGGHYVRTWVLKIGSYSSSRLINVTCFYRPLSIGIKFFEMTDRKIWAEGRRLWSAFTAYWGHVCVVVAFLSSGGPLLVPLMFYCYWVLLTIRWLPISCLYNNFSSYLVCVFLLWSFLMAEIRPILCSLLLGILCHIEPRAPWLLFTPASLGFDWGPLRSLVVFVNTAVYVLNDDESSTEVI